MYYYMAFAVFFSFWIKGISGFANSLIFGSIMSFRTNTVDISPMDLLLNMPANLFFTIKERKSISLKIVGPMAFFMLTGSIPGVFWLKTGDVTAIKLLFGVVVIILALEMLMRTLRPQEVKPSSKITLALIGLISGVCAGMFGISAMLAAYAARTTKDMSEFRGNICAVFFMDNLFRIGLYSATGILTWDIAKMAVTMVPYMVIGLLSGVFCARLVPEKTIKNMVLGLLFISGILLIATNLPW